MPLKRSEDIPGAAARAAVFSALASQAAVSASFASDRPASAAAYLKRPLVGPNLLLPLHLLYVIKQLIENR